MSSTATANQAAVNGTIQVMVPPGNQTDLYYIALSNLPWETSWQQLKDHVRTVCEVERVEVFEGSTTAWIRLRGRDNFDKALRLLNEVDFNGRAILADGRNATASMMIKDHVGNSATGSSPQSPQTPRYTTSTTQYAPGTHATTSPISPVYSGWTTATPGLPYMVTSPANSTAYNTPTSMPSEYGNTFHYSHVSGGEYRHHQSSAVSTSVGQYSSAAAYAQPYPFDQSQSHEHGYGASNNLCMSEFVPSSSHATHIGTVPTQKRKIILRHLPSSTTYRQIRELVRHKAGSDADKLQALDLPLADNHETNRGYARVTFESEEAANKLIRKLNGYSYKGRQLKAEFTSEGVSENEYARPRSTRHHTNRGQRTEHGDDRRDDRRERKERKESTKTSSSSDKKSKPHKPEIVIANGSCYTPETHDGREKRSSHK